MPSKSKSQQRLMGMVYAYLKGSLDLDKLSPSLADKIKSIADGKRKKTGDKRKFTKGIDIEAAKDFASTKHEKLPQYANESFHIMKFDEFVNESISFDDIIKICESENIDINELMRELNIN